MNLSTLDISKLTPTEASQLFNQAVAELQTASGCPYFDAFERAKILHKELAARMTDGNTAVTNQNPIQVQGFNVSSDGALALTNEGVPAQPVFGPQMKALLHLPADADSLECSTAWRATKGITTGGIDFPAIWKLLTASWSGRMPDKSPAAVELFMKQRFPQLAADVFSTTA